MSGILKGFEVALEFTPEVESLGLQVHVIVSPVWIESVPEEEEEQTTDAVGAVLSILTLLIFVLFMLFVVSLTKREML